MFIINMNKKRVLIATAIGLLCGFFCAYGTVWLAEKGELGFELTAGILAATIYNRVLMGFVIGIADGINMHPVIRGAVLGAVVGFAMSVIPVLDMGLMNGLNLMAFSVVYGVVIDIVATKFSK